MNNQEQHPNFALLYDILNAPIRWGLLKAAMELGVFGRLNDAKTSGQVAEALKTHPGNTGVLLDGLAACGLLTKHGGKYLNTEIARSYLVQGLPADLRPMLMSLAALRHRGIDNLASLVRNGPEAAGVGMDLRKEESWSKATAFLANYHRAGIGEEAASIASALPEFPAMKKMLDLGGGPGLIGMSIVKSHPAMTGVLFDLPQVARAAEAHISDMGLKGRMEVLAGDYNQDPIGKGYDLVWASLNLYYAQKDMAGLMAKVLAALNPGGVFVSYHEGLTGERTGPPEHVIGRIALAFMGQDMSFSQGVIAEAMLAAGFTSVHSRTIETSNGPIDLDIARK